MWAARIAIIASLVLAGGASGAERDDGTHWISPRREALRAMWPHDSMGHLLYGEVILDCGVGPEGRASDCRVVSSTSSDPSLTKAAMDAAALYKAQYLGFERAPLDVDMQFDEFAKPAKLPDDKAIEAAYPPEAKVRGLSGSAIIHCTAGTDGRLHACTVLKEDGSGFGQAALSLAPKVVMKPATRQGQVMESEVHLPFRWGDAPRNADPDWLRKPTLDELMAVFPAEAAKRGISGGATIICVVQTTGLPRDCTVVTEDHPGLGFGQAALSLAGTFLFKPATRDGQVVEAEVSIPINFEWAGGSPGGGPSHIQPDAPSMKVLTSAIWSKTPTVPEILSAINKKVGDKFADGKVVFQCRLDKKSGRLNGCVIANVSPGMAQFEDVAKSLVPKFQADPAELAKINGSVAINLAFAFPDMASPEWEKRYLAHPRWIQALGPDSKISTFPNVAANAGLKTGNATVDCTVSPTGALTQCTTVRESTPNVGFGETAIKIAETFVANPWDESGLPVDGAHVRMPIQMDYAPPEVPTPSTTPSASPGSPPPSR